MNAPLATAAVDAPLRLWAAMALEPFLTPVVSVSWVILIHACAAYDYFNDDSGLTGWFFVPLLLWEVFATWRFHTAHRARPVLGGGAKGWAAFGVALLGNLGFWAGLYGFWVNWGLRWPDDPMIIFCGPQFFGFFGMMWFGMGIWWVVALVGWLATCWFVVVRARVLRVLTVIILPILLTLVAFLSFFHFGGRGGKNPDRVARQEGVELLLSAEMVQAALDATPREELRWLAEPWAKPNDDTIKLVYQPRDIMVPDEDTLIVSFGCTFCAPPAPNLVMLLRADLRTGEMQFVVGDQIPRQLEFSGGDIYIAPWTIEEWHRKVVSVVSGENLRVIRDIPNQVTHKYFWETLDVAVDADRRWIFVTNEGDPALFKYDLATGELLEEVDFIDHVGAGGALYTMQEDRKTGQWYAIGFPSPKEVMKLEVDPIRVVGGTEVNDFLGTGLALDEEGRDVYYQSGLTPMLVRIDMETMEVERRYWGEQHSRRMVFDPRRRVLYQLGYVAGRLTAIDVDTGERLWSIAAGGRGHGLALEGDHLYFHSMAGAFRTHLPTRFRLSGHEGMIDP